MCLRCPTGLHPRSAQCRCRAPPAVDRSGAPAPATRQAAGAPSARSQSFNPPPRDRADGTTLGRPRHEPRRTRRPAPRDATQRGSFPAFEEVPLPRGHATPPATRLMGRRDARPHNAERRPRDANAAISGGDNVGGSNHIQPNRGGEPTPMPPRGALFMVTSEWFEESDSRSGIRFQGRDESPHGDP